MTQINLQDKSDQTFDSASQLADRAIRLAQEGKTKEAEKAFRDQIQFNQEDPVTHHNFAVFLSAQGLAEEAIKYYREALRLHPRYPEALRNFAILLSNLRRFPEAIANLWNAVSMRPEDVQTLLALGNTLMAARRTHEAIPALRQAIRFSPDEALLHNQLGLALLDIGRFEQAEESFLKALKIDPKLVATHNNLGSLYKAMGRCDEAFSCFELALTLDPSSPKTRWNRALTLLSVGELERGWEEYEWRWKRSETPPKQLPKPLWNGEPLEGRRILIHAEQGLGDTVQFIRYARLLKDLGAFVIFECQSPLIEALKDTPGVDNLICEGESIPPFDFHCPLLGLPRIFKTRESAIPTTTPYLTVQPDRVAGWKARLDKAITAGKRRIGLIWQGNPHHQWDQFRSLPLTAYESLAHLSDVQLISVQRGPGIEQIDEFQKITGNRLLVPTNGQQTAPEHLADSAAIIANLDLLITVDTLPAHIGGALGKPVWVVLSSVADWRWMINRQDSPWYPTLRLFRQSTFGNWASVIERMAMHLKQRSACEIRT